jgi:cytochrome c peroxidase
MLKFAPRSQRPGVALALLWAASVPLAACAGNAGPPSPPSLAPLVSSEVPAGFPKGTSAAQAPQDNALTELRAQLGKRLFFEPALSRTGEVSCATCHRQEFAFSDGNAVSTGVENRQGTRNAPALVNQAWGKSFFWDGRVLSLEEQAGKPIENPLEMDLSLSEAVARVAADESYRAAFLNAYGETPSEASLTKAIASFVRTLVSANSPYDRHLRGDDRDFGEQQQRGEALFLDERAGCFHCHPAGMLTNEGFFNNGSYTPGSDSGRQALTGLLGDTGKFKVPGLRNVAVSAPYMHDGSLPNLEAVIDQYDHGGRGDVTTDPQIAALSLLDQEKQDLLAFLRSLTDPTFLEDPRFRP